MTTWEQVLADAGVPGKRYLSVDSYPDEELFALVLAASRRAGRPTSGLLEDFGEHLAPALAQTYSAFIPEEWRTLDLLEHTESVIHKAVRLSTPGATPPRLTCTRPSATQIQISYRSERKLCSLGRGLIRGVSHLYRERVEIDHDGPCMLMGAPTCELEVRLVR